MAPKKKAVKKSAAKPAKKPAPKASRPAAKPVTTAQAAKVHARAAESMKMDEGCCGGECCSMSDKTTCCGFTCTCPLFGVISTRAFWQAAALAFIVAFAFDMWWNGHLLMREYQNTAQFWRPLDQMKQFLPWCLLRHAGLGMAVAALVLLMGRTRWWGGFITGVLALTPVAIDQLSVYMFMPLPSIHLPAMWAVGALLQGGLMGLAVTAVARSKSNACCGGSCDCK